jgi:hypothetical protein
MLPSVSRPRPNVRVRVERIPSDIVAIGAWACGLHRLLDSGGDRGSLAPLLRPRHAERVEAALKLSSEDSCARQQYARGDALRGLVSGCVERLGGQTGKQNEDEASAARGRTVIRVPRPDQRVAHFDFPVLSPSIAGTSGSGEREARNGIPRPLIRAETGRAAALLAIRCLGSNAGAGGAPKPLVYRAFLTSLASVAMPSKGMRPGPAAIRAEPGGRFAFQNRAR